MREVRDKLINSKKGVSACPLGRVMKPKKSLGILALYFVVDLIYIKTGEIF
jgi:hypothetical protein